MEEKAVKRRSFWGGILVGVLTTGIILTSIFVYDFINIKKEYDKAVESASSGIVSSSNQLATTDFAAKAEKIYNKICKEFYYTEDIDAGKMQDEMYKAILSATGDRYAEYYTAEEYKAFFEDAEGIYYGIGSYVEIDSVTNYPLLSGVFEDSPASRAGLETGDIIYKVDGKDIGGLSLTEVVSLIKGPENSEVEITVSRDGKLITVTVIRGKVISPSVTHEMLSDSVGYIQLTAFEDATVDQFKAAYEDIKSQNAKGLIIDLRDNGGGNLSTVLEICKQLLPNGLITYIEYKDGSKDEYYCDGKNEIQIPVVVLTNGNTASASELMTGALRDYKKATIIGTNTFGKGIVQNIFSLGDGTGMKITIASYYTPLGECIHKVGIAPDIELEFDSERYTASKRKEDNQKEYALKYLTDIIGQ